MDDLLHHFDEHIRVLRVLRRLVASSDPLAIRTAFAIIASELATEEPPRTQAAIRQARYRANNQTQDSRRIELVRDRALCEAIRRRDGDQCRYCGVSVNWSDRRSRSGATYDHVDPRGGNTIDNVVIACHQCNIVKNARTPEQAGFVLRAIPESTPRSTPINTEINAELKLDNVVPVVQSLETTENQGFLGRESLSRDSRDLDTQRELRLHALEILRFLNEKTGRNYREKDTNLRLIQARLRDGASVQDCKAVIARKWREWRDDPVMNKYCRPATLFGALKFEQYVGEKERPQ